MIIYFSGTGNSYSIAKHMGHLLNEKIIPMKKAYNDKTPNLVFVFPTYCMDIPSYVKAFIKQFPIEKNQNIIGISTSGGDSGRSEYTFNKLIEQKGFTVNQFIEIVMTDNSFPVLFGGSLKHREIDEEAVLKERLKIKYVNQSTNNFSAILAEWILFNPVIKRYYKKKVALDLCNGCGLCSTICPVDNIQVRNDKACVGSACAECYGCIHVCPNQAIRARKPIQRKNQFRNENAPLNALNQ